MNIKSILIKIFPLLYSVASRIWDKTPKELQLKALMAVHFTQIIKENLTAEPGAVLLKTAESLNISVGAADIALAAAAKVVGLPNATSTAFIAWAQDKANQGLSDIAWNQHWDNIAKMLAIILSGNKIDWLSLMLGLLQIALEIFKKAA